MVIEVKTIFIKTTIHLKKLELFDNLVVLGKYPDSELLLKGNLKDMPDVCATTLVQYK